LTVALGTTVTWKNTDTAGHYVTSGQPSDNTSGTVFDSGNLIKPGNSYQFTFQNSGTYNYHCSVHPWMTGQVIVNGNASNTSHVASGNSPTEPDVLKGPSTSISTTSAQCDQPNMKQDSVHQVTTTDSSSMVVEYRYSPSNPHDGCPIEFRLSFEQNFDQSQKFSNVQYDIFIVDSNDHKLYSLAQDKGRTALFAPVGDDDNTFTLKGTTPVTHFVITAFGTGPEGSLPDTSSAGLVRVDVKTQESFGGPTNPPAIPLAPNGTQNNGTSITPPTVHKIPNWVKSVFGYYAQGNLSDDDLIKALQFLIQQGIIKIS
jgi:hypothetical protein